MKNPPPLIQTGDKVRVVLEGEVFVPSVQPSRRPGYFNIGSEGAIANPVYPTAEHVVSIEVLKPPIKVGDKPTWREIDGADLPVGSLIQGVVNGEYYLRSDSGWTSDRYPWAYLNGEFQVHYIPTA